MNSTFEPAHKNDIPVTRPCGHPAIQSDMSSGTTYPFDSVTVEGITLFSFIEKTPYVQNILDSHPQQRYGNTDIEIETGTGKKFYLSFREVSADQIYQRDENIKSGLVLTLSFNPSEWVSRHETGSNNGSATDRLLSPALEELNVCVLSHFRNPEGRVLSAGDLSLRHLTLGKSCYVDISFSLGRKYRFNLSEHPEIMEQLVDVFSSFLETCTYRGSFADVKSETFSKDGPPHPYDVDSAVFQEDGIDRGTIQWKVDFYRNKDRDEEDEYEKFDQLRTTAIFFPHDDVWDMEMVKQEIDNFATQ